MNENLFDSYPNLALRSVCTLTNLTKRGNHMSENVEPLETGNGDTEEDGKRQRSTIGFPYSDYDSAYALAAAIHANVGHGECSSAQLAAWTNQSVKSSGFRTQIAAARLFGLIDSASSDDLHLTDLGRQAVDPAQARAAKADAFLRVPLFKAIHDKYKDGVTPPSAALEREIVALGVSEKQKARARQVFESSAQQTGFRDAAPNRLVMPAIVVKPNTPPPDLPKFGGSGGGGESDLGLDPLLMALLRKIPKALDWPTENRLRWFRTFAMNVSQVYDDDDNPVELEIKVKDAEGNSHV